MSNTSIQLKKSGITGNTPVDLQHGEVAINYADGKLYYKSSIDDIKYITNQDSFATFNVNNILVLASSPTDTLSLTSTGDITLSSNTISKTITIGSNSVAGSYANAAFIQANAAYDYANTLSAGSIDSIARGTANAAFIQANAAFAYANTMSPQDNVARDTANSAASYANAAFIQANAVFQYANTLSPQDNVARYTANSAALYANGAFVQANAAYQSQNTTGTYANSAYAQANSASLYANGAFVEANAAYGQANSAGVYANAAFLQANTPSYTANSAALYANSAFIEANAAYGQANSASLYANAAFIKANAAYESQNTTGSYANSSFSVANSASIYANGAFIEANASYSKANSAGLYANAAFLEANSANTLANSKAAVYTQDTAPTDVNVDDIWIDSATGIEYVNVRSNNATQWVEFGATGTPLNGTGGLGFSEQTMYGVDAGTDVKIQQIGTGNIILQSSNTVITGNLIANAPGKKAEFNNISAVYFRVNTATTIANSAAINIVASTGYYVQPPTSDGYVLQATGKDNVPSRIVIDSAGSSSYSAFIGRHARGTHQNPTAAQNGDMLARFSGNGYGATGYGVNAGGASVDIYAIENYTDTARGASIVLSATTNGTNVRTTIATFTSNNVTITGQLNAQKGFASSPRTVTNASSVVIDFTADSVIRVINNIGATISFTNYYPGKQVDVWVTNTDNNSKSFTHGCTATNSTNNNTTKSIPATSSMLLRYICFDGDSANVQVAIIQG
jgi:hypothetical protein